MAARKVQEPAAPLQRVRCAVYTRKSNDEGLDGDFSSLDAQREAAEAFIVSQKSAGWMALPTRYDDGAISGGTLERPALKRLLDDVEAGRVDVVVVYKIDRLSRSLRDFGRLIELFERHEVSFVSVTQRFDTSTSMGKLTLNILMSFAEFEREVTRERIRDKIALAKQRGKHTGGIPVLGYTTDPVAKRLLVVPEEAAQVRHIFERFVALRSTTKLAEELSAAGHTKKSWVTARGKRVGGGAWVKSQLYHVLHNVKYLGLVEHLGKTYPGEHEAIIAQGLWDEVQAVFQEQHRARGNRTRARSEALLRGILRCVHCDRSMGPHFSRQHGKVYRYYLCSRAGKDGHGRCPVRMVAAGPIEEAVVSQLRAVFRAPEIVARTLRETERLQEGELKRLEAEVQRLEAEVAEHREKLGRLAALKSPTRAMADELARVARAIDDATDRHVKAAGDLEALRSKALSERDVVAALASIDGVWRELFPDERARIVSLLVSRVDVRPDGLEVRLRAEGLRSIAAELGMSTSREEVPA